jgi:hypothetical protein
MAFALIGRLAGPIESRSIIIQLKRRLASEPIQSLRLDRPIPKLVELTRKAARWWGAPIVPAAPGCCADGFRRDRQGRQGHGQTPDSRRMQREKKRGLQGEPRADFTAMILACFNYPQNWG